MDPKKNNFFVLIRSFLISEYIVLFQIIFYWIITIFAFKLNVVCLTTRTVVGEGGNGTTLPQALVFQN